MRHAGKPGNAVMRVMYRIGRRGSYLIFLGLLDILYGYSIFVQAGPLFSQTNLYLPDKVWGTIWVTTAVVLFINAFLRLDRVGYVVATVIKFVWGVIMGYAWLAQPNDPRGWVAMIIWFAFGVLTAIVANWPEHTMPQIGVFNDHNDGDDSSSAPGGPTG